ncbi:MAG: preprotein translocase subunit SecY [Calditrichaeota bacterium]|nr:MAG: preprotein translocase subunit SecY [Calditrichota bacterium]
MIETLQRVFSIPELKKRILFTIMIVGICRIGTHITLPGVDSQVLLSAFDQVANSFLGLYNIFTGGAFSRATIFALGIMPYISVSIIIQLFTSVSPYFQRLQKEGEDGRRKITQITRVGTVAVSGLQAAGVATLLSNNLALDIQGSVVPNPDFAFYLTTIITLVTGTIFLMWLGEQITEKGVGNGISLIITIGIIDLLPNAILEEGNLIASQLRTPLTEVVLIVFLIAVTAATVSLTQAFRKIPTQRVQSGAKGGNVYSAKNSYIPLKVNTAGVMPIIFAQSVIVIPGTLASFFPNSDLMTTIAQSFSYTSFWYHGVSALLIVFFTYFYTAIAFNPAEVADNMKKQGVFVPGVKPGKPTADFIDDILSKITLPGSIFLALITLLPYFVQVGVRVISPNESEVSPNFASFFGGTSLLILVGVALDTVSQIESHLLMKKYDGLTKTGRIRGQRN